MASEEINEDNEGSAAPRRPSSRTGSPRLEAAASRPASRPATGSRPVTSSGRTPTGGATGSRPVSSRTASRPVEPAPVQDMRSTSTRAQVILEEFEKSGGKDRTMLWVWSGLGVVVITGVVMAIIYSSKGATREKERKEKLDRRDMLMKEVESAKAGPDGNATMAAIDKALAFLTTDEKLFSKDVRTLNDLRVTVVAKIQQEEAMRKNLEMLKQAEEWVDDKTYSKLPECRARKEILIVAASTMDEDFKKRVKAFVDKLELNNIKATAQKAEDEAAKAGSDTAKALEAYDAAVATFKDILKNYKSTGKDDPVINAYKEMLGKSDALAAQLCTADYIEKTPARDMLLAREQKNWGTSKDNPCDYVFQGRELIISHKPVEGKKLTEILSLDGWSKPAWHDIQIDLEFEILSQGFELYIRYIPGYKNFMFPFPGKDKQPADGYDLNTPAKMTIRVIGSTVTMQQGDQAQFSGTIDPTVSRTGGIGIGVPTGGKVAIKSCTVKVLRPRAQ